MLSQPLIQLRNFSKTFVGIRFPIFGFKYFSEYFSKTFMGNPFPVKFPSIFVNRFPIVD